MHIKTSCALLVAASLLAACGNDGESMGNGPGNADGVGGREDPPQQITNEAPTGASTTDAAGAHTTPDGSTEDTGATPQERP